ncbi:MAG: pentapeptide repeat-containing protein [Arthrospira sp. PLM2.Bin9]|nr:pentapeptide repeat-containing protein [Arthrospira sp. PLM2.Bin9]TVU54716.1 MAG: pentapeptide repeat-containing protein [Arthrospira sp. PLM2.Bin9]
MKTLSTVMILGAATTIVSLGFASPIRAENPAHLKQLLETRLCQGCDLRGADLSGAHLIGVDLRNANLENANLANANLEGADLKGANLTGANLSGAFLNQAELNDAVLDLADLSGANLIKARLTGATFAGANLQETQMLQPIIGITPPVATGSLEDLGGDNLSIGRDPSRLAMPMGGTDLDQEFQYTQEYLESLFEPIQINRHSLPPLEGFTPGDNNPVDLKIPQIRF